MRYLEGPCVTSRMGHAWRGYALLMEGPCATAPGPTCSYTADYTGPQGQKSRVERLKANVEPLLS